MQLKISRSGGNYLVLNLKGAVLTHFTAAGEVGIQLVNGKEGDDQFRKFLAQVIEDSPMLADLEDQNAELRQKVAALTERIEELKDSQILRPEIKIEDALRGQLQANIDKVPEAAKPITELKSCVAAPIAVDVLETNIPKPSAEHIFAGKSRPWLEGFAANREWRLELNECDKRGDPQVPVEPGNPYPRASDVQKQRVSWANGWRECCRYLLDEMPDPTSHLEQAK